MQVKTSQSFLVNQYMRSVSGGTVQVVAVRFVGTGNHQVKKSLVTAQCLKYLSTIVRCRILPSSVVLVFMEWSNRRFMQIPRNSDYYCCQQKTVETSMQMRMTDRLIFLSGFGIGKKLRGIGKSCITSIEA